MLSISPEEQQREVGHQFDPGFVSGAAGLVSQRPLMVLCSICYGSSSVMTCLLLSRKNVVFIPPGWSKPQVSSVHNSSLGCPKLQI